MAKKKSQDVNAKTAINHINSLDTIAEVNEYVADEVDTKNRKTVLGAAIERAEELSEEKVTDKPNMEGAKSDSDTPAFEPSKETEEKAKSESKPAEKKAEKKTERTVPLREIITRAVRTQWKKEPLFNMIKDTYPDEEVRMEVLNPSQVAFFVGEDRIPEEGYLTVSTRY